MHYRALSDGYIVQLSIDEPIEPALVEFGRLERVDSAHLWGIGAAKEIVLGSYDLRGRTYRKVELDGIWEIASLAGTLAAGDEGPILHLHGVFSDESCRTFGGHVFSLTCAATVELYLVSLSPALTRKYDDVTGLKLLDL
jgi:predicted DNA-binding protein with PD1-like motif